MHKVKDGKRFGEWWKEVDLVDLTKQGKTTLNSIKSRQRHQLLAPRAMERRVNQARKE